MTRKKINLQPGHFYIPKHDDNGKLFFAEISGNTAAKIFNEVIDNSRVREKKS